MAKAMMYNTAAALFAQGCEVDRRLQIVGALTCVATGLPGAGDSYVTSASGRTVRLGSLLGKVLRYQQARQITAGVTLESAEIIRAMGEVLPVLTERGKVRPDELPSMRALIDIVVHGQPVDLPFDKFFGNMKEDHAIDSTF